MAKGQNITHFEIGSKMRIDTASYGDKITLDSMGDKRLWAAGSWQPTLREVQSSIGTIGMECRYGSGCLKRAFDRWLYGTRTV